MLPPHPFDLAGVVAADHRLAETLFGRIERNEGRRQVLFDQVILNLSVHGAAMEQVVGPALTEIGDETSAGENVTAMQPVKEALVALDRHDAGTDEAELAMRIVVQTVRALMPLVEREQLPRLRDALGDERMVELGRSFLDHARKAPTRPHPHAPSATVVAAPAAIVDRMRDRMSGRDMENSTDASGALDPQAQLLVDEFAALGVRPVHLLEPAAARKQPTFADAVDAYLRREGRHAGPEEVGDVQERLVPGGAVDVELPVRVYHPAAGDGVLDTVGDGVDDRGRPVFVYVHGGGWVVASIDAYDATCRSMANRAGAIVVSVGYRQAPEHSFPAAHDDVLAAFRWVQAHAAELGGDPQRIAIGGESAGGNLAAATTAALIAEGAPLPIAQVLVYPVTSTATDWSSFADAADASPLYSSMVPWFLGHLIGTPADLADPRLDLLSVPTETLASMPPTLVVTAGRDPLCDQGEAFANRLNTAGVAVEAIRYPGMPHEFFGAGAVLDAAVDAQRRAAQVLRGAFGAAVTVDVGSALPG